MAYKTAKCPIKNEETSEPCNRGIRYRPGSWDYVLRDHVKVYHWKVNEILKEIHKLGGDGSSKEPDDNEGGWIIMAKYTVTITYITLNHRKKEKTYEMEKFI